MALVHTDKQRIQSTLRDIARTGGGFFAQTYDETTGDPNPIDTNNPVEPINARANEVSSAFEPDTRTGRKQQMIRKQWIFRLLLEFAGEVTGEFFEEQFMQNVIHLPRDPAQGFNDITIYLISTQAEHPPQFNASGGSKFQLAFMCVPARI